MGGFIILELLLFSMSVIYPAIALLKEKVIKRSGKSIAEIMREL
jgi:hypothetical protein